LKISKQHLQWRGSTQFLSYPYPFNGDCDSSSRIYARHAIGIVVIRLLVSVTRWSHQTDCLHTCRAWDEDRWR
jgi:hypothetical protein